MAEEVTQTTKRDHTLYLGQTKNFADLNGNAYPESFWIKGIVVDSYKKTLEIRNYGFPSIPEFNDGAYPFSEQDTGIKSIIFRGEAFDRIIAANAPLVSTIIYTMKQIQLLVKDFPNENGSEMVSFFEDAADVPFPGE